MYSIRRLTVTLEIESPKGRIKRDGMNIEFYNGANAQFPVDNITSIAGKFVMDKVALFANEFYKEEQNLLETAE